MPVHLWTTLAMSFSSTSSSICRSDEAQFAFSSPCSISGMVPYLISLAFSHSELRSADSNSNLAWSKFSFSLWREDILSFCACHLVLKSKDSASSLLRFSTISFILSFESLSDSFINASFSIFNWMIFLSTRSKLSGLLSACILMLEQASSIKSIALSGKNLSPM